jgi:hypothetical protein
MITGLQQTGKIIAQVNSSGEYRRRYGLDRREESDYLAEWGNLVEERPVGVARVGGRGSDLDLIDSEEVCA